MVPYVKGTLSYAHIKVTTEGQFAVKWDSLSNEFDSTNYASIFFCTDREQSKRVITETTLFLIS